VLTNANDKKILKKTDVLVDGTIIKVYTNKKAQWQHK
jgi:hypothetical protein